MESIMASPETIGHTATYLGSGTACTAAATAATYPSESTILLIIAIIGTSVSVAGFLYTMYNGNRHFKLALAQAELERQERIAAHEHTSKRLEAVESVVVGA